MAETLVRRSPRPSPALRRDLGVAVSSSQHPPRFATLRSGMLSLARAMRMRVAGNVAFEVSHFAFAALRLDSEDYTSAIEPAGRFRPPLGVTIVSFIARLLSRKRNGNVTTARERSRLQRTMPGQTGAMLASRHGLFV